MINAEQIRSARALLDWSTADLAKISGLTLNGLNRIERSHGHPQKETLALIQKTFEEAGLEFLPSSGVKKKEQIIVIWEDDDAGQRLLDDVYYTLRDVGGEVLISGVDEGRSAAVVSRERMAAHIARLRECGVKERLLIKEGDTDFIGPLETYHWIPEKYFSSDSFRVYGSKLALIVWGKPQKVIIIDDARMAESVRKLFDFVWDHTKGPADEGVPKKA